jgi:hypothetical protein
MPIVFISTPVLCAAAAAGIHGVQQQMQQVATAAGVELQQPNSKVTDRLAVAVEAQQQRTNSSNRQQSAPVIEAEVVTSSSSSTSSSGSSSHGSSSSSSGGKRSWGAWADNRRIKSANAALVKDSSKLTPSQQQQQQQQSGSSSSRSSRGAAQPAAAAAAAAEVQTEVQTEFKASSEEDAVLTEDGAKIFSRKLGVKRPKKVTRDPLERQMLVKDALKAAAEQMSGEAAVDQDSSSSSSSMPGSSSSSKEQWWQERYQALYMPSIKYADGSVGFVQMDVSLNPAVKDVRVLTFEDRHDCMKCLSVMRQWQQMAGAKLSMGAMQSGQIEQQIR